MDKLELVNSAFRAIRTNKTRSILTTLGIVIGVASVILLTAIGVGLQKFVTAQFEDLGSNVVFVVPGKVNVEGGPGRPVITSAKFTFKDVENIGRLGEPIRLAVPIIFKTGTAKFKNETYDVTVNGVTPDYPKIRNLKVAQGQFITQAMVERGSRTMVVGPKVADNLRVGLGKDIVVSGTKFTIVGIVESKGGGFGSNSDQDAFVYIPITTSQKVLGEENPGSFSVQTTDPANNAVATNMIKRYFDRRNLTEDDFTVLEPKEIVASINQFLGAVTAALSGIAAISLVVGGIGIANIMLVSVTARTRVIGLRKAIGATRGDILWQFLIEAVVLSALGGLLGIGIGYGLAALANRFIETAVTWKAVALAFDISSLVGIVSGLAPAIRAARLDPIKALRYE